MAEKDQLLGIANFLIDYENRFKEKASELQINRELWNEIKAAPQKERDIYISEDTTRNIVTIYGTPIIVDGYYILWKDYINY